MFTVTKGDIAAIRDDWITDNVSATLSPSLSLYLTFTQAIAFWQEWIEHEELSKHPKAMIELLRPSMSFLLLSIPDPLSLKGVLPDFSNTTHIFLPINNNSNPEEASGGSHWSLLLVSLLDNVAFHYDSLTPSNHKEAFTTVEKLSVLTGKNLKFVHMEDAPQQENGSDCGMFVCILMKHLLLTRLLKADSNTKVTMSMAGREVNAALGRKVMLKTIDNLRKEQEKNRSRSGSPRRRSKSPRHSETETE